MLTLVIIVLERENKVCLMVEKMMKAVVLIVWEYLKYVRCQKDICLERNYLIKFYMEFKTHVFHPR